MSRTIAAGIDIGTFEIKVVIAEEALDASGRLLPKVLGRGTAEARGLRQGYVVSSEEASRSVRQALDQAEKAAGVRVKRAFVSVGGIGLTGIVSTGTTVISRADLEVTERDLALVQESAEAQIPKENTRNRKIINTIPIEFKLDGRPAWGRIEGQKAQKIEAKILFISCLEHHIEDLIHVVEETGVEVIDVSPSPLAASFVTVSKKQKKAGCCLANLGAETTSVLVFEDGTPISLEVLPCGSQNLTEDIALGLRVTLEEAETLKRGADMRTAVSKKKYDSIVNSQLDECFEMIEQHLRKLERERLLPAGIIFTGGGALLHGLKEEAEKILDIPASIAEVRFGTDERRIKDNPWAVAYGLCVLAFNADGERRLTGANSMDKIREGGKRSLRTLSRWFSQFLP